MDQAALFKKNGALGRGESSGNTAGENHNEQTSNNSAGAANPSVQNSPLIVSSSYAGESPAPEIDASHQNHGYQWEAESARRRGIPLRRGKPRYVLIKPEGKQSSKRYLPMSGYLRSRLSQSESSDSIADPENDLESEVSPRKWKGKGPLYLRKQERSERQASMRNGKGKAGSSRVSPADNLQGRSGSLSSTNQQGEDPSEERGRRRQRRLIGNFGTVSGRSRSVGEIYFEAASQRQPSSSAELRQRSSSEGPHSYPLLHDAAKQITAMAKTLNENEYQDNFAYLSEARQYLYNGPLSQFMNDQTSRNIANYAFGSSILEMLTWNRQVLYDINKAISLGQDHIARRDNTINHLHIERNQMYADMQQLQQTLEYEYERAAVMQAKMEGRRGETVDVGTQTTEDRLLKGRNGARPGLRVQRDRSDDRPLRQRMVDMLSRYKQSATRRRGGRVEDELGNRAGSSRSAPESWKEDSQKLMDYLEKMKKK